MNSSNRNGSTTNTTLDAPRKQVITMTPYGRFSNYRDVVIIGVMPDHDHESDDFFIKEMGDEELEKYIKQNAETKIVFTEKQILTYLARKETPPKFRCNCPQFCNIYYPRFTNSYGRGRQRKSSLEEIMHLLSEVSRDNWADIHDSKPFECDDRFFRKLNEAVDKVVIVKYQDPFGVSYKCGISMGSNIEYIDCAETFFNSEFLLNNPFHDTFAIRVSEVIDIIVVTSPTEEHIDAMIYDEFYSTITTEE